MKLVEFSFRNIFSYGNKLQTIKIEQDVPKLVLIQGPKGQGKSSIKEAIIVSAYGKSPTKKLGKIPNRINKNAYLSTKFIDRKGQVIEIERGFEPSFLNVKINGSLDNPINKIPNKTLINQDIENKLIEIPFAVANNTVAISVNDFKSFVSLSPDDKRKIIDRIFGIEDINSMNEINKAEIKALNDKIKILDNDIIRTEEMLGSMNAKLEQIQKEVDTEATAQIESLKSEIKTFETEKEDAKIKYNKVVAETQSLTKEKEKIQESITKNIGAIAEIQKKLDIYAKNKCPHCLSNLEDDTHVNIKGKLEKMMVDYKAKNPEFKKQLEQQSIKINDSAALQEKVKEEFYAIDGKIKVNNSKINEISAKLNSASETKKIVVMIDELMDKLNNYTATRSNNKEELVVNLELAQAFSNDGMKSLLMAQIIPMINQKIIERSSEIDFKYSFEFTDQFDPIINQLGQSVDLEELSTGEQKEMNLITLFCILDLILMKSNLNFLFLDEIYTSLDRDSIYKVVSMLRSFVDQHKITVFTISHDPLPEEFFDQKLIIKKENYFSDIEFA